MRKYTVARSLLHDRAEPSGKAVASGPLSQSPAEISVSY
jgi:hypothetical protein